MIVNCELTPLAKLLEEHGPARKWKAKGGEIVETKCRPGAVLVVCKVDSGVKTLELLNQKGIPFKEADVSGHQGTATITIKEK